MELLKNELVELRHKIHKNPEVGFEENSTSVTIAGFLKSLGIEVHTGLGVISVVGVVKKGNSTRVIGLRADMNALSIHEVCAHDYTSKIDEKMHACGHDGHFIMFLGAAKLISQKGVDFGGIVCLVFQPAEEHGMGAKAMLKENLI